jgi:FkbM family methyltransferase
MAVSAAFHRRVRAVTKHYPWTSGAVLLTRLLGRLYAADDPLWSLWLASGGAGGYPSLALNVAIPAQRKVYYFTKAYVDFYWKKPLAQFMAATLRPGDVFVDIGANLGMFTWLAARLVGSSGRVLAFEADPSTFESLSRTAQLQGQGQVIPRHFALSDHTAQATFYRTRDGFAHSLVPEAPGREGRYFCSTTVPVSSLDGLVASGEVPLTTVALIKVDVEGEEPRTVAGMLDTLARASFPPLWCEVRGPQGSTRAPNTFAAVLKQLASLGYQSYRWKNGKADLVEPRDVRGREDILFKHASRAIGRFEGPRYR